MKRILLKKEKTVPVTNGWLESFCILICLYKRFPAGSDPTETMLDNYFDILEDVQEENGLREQSYYAR